MQTNTTAQGLSVHVVLKALRRRKFYLLIPMVLVTAAFAYYAMKQPERFRARVMLAAESAIPRDSVRARADAAAIANITEQLRTIRETLLNRRALETVIREFNLYPLDTKQATDEAIENLKSNIDLQVEGTDAFYVSYQGSDRQQVMQVTNRLAEMFVERNAELRGNQTEAVTGFLDAEVDRLRKQLTGKEQSVQSYKQGALQELPERLTTNLKLLETMQQQIQAKSDKITEDQARRAAAQEEMKALEKQGVLESRDVREKSPTDAKLEELRLKLKQLRARYQPRHLEVIQTEKEIQDLEATRSRVAPRASEPSPAYMRYLTLKSDLESIDQRVKSYQQERAALESQMSIYERRVQASPWHERELLQRTRDSDVARTQYEALLARQQEAKLDQRLEKSHKGIAFRIIQAATLPSAPFSPQRHRIILMGFLAGAGLGLLLILIAEQMDTSFDTIENFRGFTNLPVLATVPSIPSAPLIGLGSGRSADQKRFQKHRLITLSDPVSVPSEQYSILALHVRQWMEQAGAQVLAVTSAAGAEGKSTTALNLGVALSSSLEGKVLLLDGDLRRPQVHERLGLPPDHGFSDLLLGADDISEYVSKVEDLYVIPGGAHLANPVGVLASRRAREVLARLKKEFQFILLDTPPIMPIADGHILAGLADGVVLVVRARHTRRELLQRAVETLGASNVLGVVLNDVEYGDTRYAYVYRYYQTHYLGRR
jgi:succinoglycan biosynthesis transport protein ExoP